MKQDSMTAAPVAPNALEEIEIGYFFALLKRYWKTLALAVAIGMALTSGYYALQKDTYEAKIILMPSKSETPSAAGLLGLASLAKDGSGDMDFFFALMKTEPVTRRLFGSRIPDSLGKDSVRVAAALELDSLGPKEYFTSIQNFQKKIKVESQEGGLYQITMQAGSRWLCEALLNGLVGAAFHEFREAQRNRIEGLLTRLKIAIDSAQGERETANQRLVGYKERNLGVERPQSLAILNDLNLEYRVKEEKYLLVKKEMEMSNLELVKSLPPITVLGAAESPPWRISPRKKIIFPAGLFLSFAFGYVFVLVRDLVRQRQA
jgi:uncharacterized protein involved in exopolysaccharide biosynthesis